jgi:hypothetical protein
VDVPRWHPARLARDDRPSCSSSSSGPGRLQAVLELPAARWIGARSYGIYLWHWPVFLVIGADLPVAPGSPAYLATRVWCVVMTLVIADLSYRFIETPVRRHGFRGTAGRALARLRAMGTRGARVLWGLALVLALVVTVVLVTAPERTATEELITANEAAPRSRGHDGILG